MRFAILVIDNNNRPSIKYADRQVKSKKSRSTAKKVNFGKKYRVFNLSLFSCREQIFLISNFAYGVKREIN
jgi:hypothetical protein